MSSLNLASLPPAGATINPSSGAPAPSQRNAPAAVDLSAPPDKAVEAKDAGKDERGFFDRMWGKEGFSFGALIDIINPLQHIPVVGTVYRAITGDSIGPAARIAGGTLFGGVFGLVASSIDTAVKEETGRDIGQHMLALRDDGDVLRDPTTPTGRPERDSVLYAGDFSPRNVDPAVVPTTMLAQAAPQAPAVQTVAAAPQAIPAAQAAPVQTARAQPQQHEAANGAGGAPVPLNSTVSRNARSTLPTPQAIASDPALLRQMQSARPQSTAIRASATSSDGAVSRTFLDYTPKNAALRSNDAETRAQTAQDMAVQPAEPADRRQAAPAAASAAPQVPGDLISRMNMALEKYQQMQGVTNRPNVNVTQ